MWTEENYLKARLRAVEGLMEDVLRERPDLLEALIERAAEPPPSNAPNEVQLERAARRQLLTRAKYPGGLLAGHELAALGKDAARRRTQPRPVTISGGGAKLRPCADASTQPI